MFNCCTVNTPRSCGRLEKCINCRMNGGWIHCIRKTGNYLACHDSLSISDMGNRVHMNSSTCVSSLKILRTAHFFYIWTLFSFPRRRQENWSWSMHRLSSLPVLQHAGDGAWGNVVPHHWSCQIETKTALFGTAHQCHSWELQVFSGLKEPYPALCFSSSVSTQRG